MKKTLVRLLIVAVIFVIAAVVVMALFLDSAVKKGIETFGPQVAKVPFTLERARISLFSGEGQMKSLVVGNPEGFKTPSAIQVSNIQVQVRPGSLLGNKIIVNTVKIDAPVITLEGGLQGNNLSKILANVEEYSSPAKSGKTSEPAPGKKMQVNELVIIGAHVNVSLNTLGGKSATISLPDIRLANLGAGPEGITGAEIAEAIVKALLDNTLQSAGQIAIKVGNGLSETATGVGNTAKEASKSASESLNKAAKGIGDLFKK